MATKTNHNIAALDTLAEELGLSWSHSSGSRRKFDSGASHYAIKPAGGGLLRVDVSVDGKQEAMLVCQLPRVQALMRQMAV